MSSIGLSGMMIVVGSLMGLTSVVRAQEAPTDYVGGLHVWSLSCSKHGYKLTSKYPLSWYDANFRYQEKTVDLYLGQTCDAQASAQKFGKGRWCWANGGFVADLSGQRIGFARQELICGQKRLPMDCRC
ncbi:MAG: hypothetical protein OIF58_06080 [Cohaesibacter sp.]|nr:hypothetical protein [Cohaesibacter sp.]